MAIKTSTGLRNKMLVTGSFKSLMDGGKILIYGGASSAVIPVSADDSATGLGATLLSTITVGSGATGLTFATTAVGGVVTKTTSETWSGNNVATGTAQFYRLVSSTDTGASSTTDARVQGTISTAGADLNLSSVSLTNGSPQTIDFFSMALPTA